MEKARHPSSQKPCLWQGMSCMCKPGLNDMQWGKSMKAENSIAERAGSISASLTECEPLSIGPHESVPGTVAQGP